MDYEDIIKKVQWLDDQERKSKTEFSELTARITSLNASITALSKQLKGVDQQVGELAVAAARIDQFEKILAKQRTEIAKSLETVEKNALRREQDASKTRQAEAEEMRKSLFEMRSTLAAEQAALKDRALEDQRRNAAIQDLGAAVDAAVKQSREAQDSYRVMEEARRQDSKRLTDLQGEMAAVRKRTDEIREKSILYGDNIRNVENRITELLESEAGRQERHAAQMQQQALLQVERDRAWKEWQEKYESFNAQAGNAAAQVTAFENSVRAARQAQEAYDGITQRLERRMAEIGEIQRLADERMRQEWIAFKADEQKRWTGHTLTQDEAIRDLRRDADKMEQHVAALDDTVQTMRDEFEQTAETTEKQLQELINISQDWLAAYERIMGHNKAKAKKAVR